MKIVNYLLGLLIYSLRIIIPNQKGLWIFGAWGGEKYLDNPKYLYEYVSKNKKNIRAIWLTHNEQVIKDLREKGKRVYKIKSVKGLYYSIRATHAFISHGLVDVNRYATYKLKVIQNWHGTPIKPVLLSDQKKVAVSKRRKLKFASKIFPFLKYETDYENYFLIPCTSIFTEKLYKKIFGDRAKTKVLGMARIDGLFNTEDSNYDIYATKDLKVRQTIMYIPTYRFNDEFNTYQYLIDNLEFITNYLIHSDSRLLLKLHPFDQTKSINDKELLNSNRIFVIDDSCDTYSILRGVDVLISDYSSVVFDFLSLNRKIFLLRPDYKDYIEKHGEFVFDFEQNEIPIFTEWIELIDGLSNWDKDLSTISKNFHQFYDNKNCERIYKYLMNHQNA